MNSINTTQKPSWLELPEEEKQRHTYWSTQGKYPIERSGSAFQSSFWSCIYHSQEEAEADACIPRHSGWTWNRKPAAPITLQEAMNNARALGRRGVSVQGYSDGHWMTLKEYPAGVPLLPKERKL